MFTNLYIFFNSFKICKCGENIICSSCYKKIGFIMKNAGNGLNRTDPFFTQNRHNKYVFLLEFYENYSSRGILWCDMI